MGQSSGIHLRSVHIGPTFGEDIAKFGKAVLIGFRQSRDRIFESRRFAIISYRKNFVEEPIGEEGLEAFEKVFERGCDRIDMVIR